MSVTEFTEIEPFGDNVKVNFVSRWEIRRANRYLIVDACGQVCQMRG